MIGVMVCTDNETLSLTIRADPRIIYMLRQAIMSETLDNGTLTLSGIRMKTDISNPERVKRYVETGEV